MYRLFTDKVEVFECEVKLEGASLTSSKARIVVESQDINLLFNGTIDSDGKCRIPIKRLKGLLGENTKGTLKLEVIAEDTYFIPWSSDFTVEAAKKVTVEVKSQQAQKIVENATPTAPAVKVSGVKNQIAVPITEHIIRLVKLLVKEDIKLSNLKIKRDKLNNIVATYLERNPLKETQTKEVIDGLLQNLPK